MKICVCNKEGNMKEVAIVYYSGTGNTEEMAQMLISFFRDKAQVRVFNDASTFTPDIAQKYNYIAFGCPAMGNEVLEEDTFEPMFSSILPLLENKNVILFGSYGWGDGEWMRNWEDEVRGANALLKMNGIICQEAPTGETKILLEEAGKALLE